MRSDSINDTTWGFGDLIPQFALRWNAGVNNYMTYITGDIPVGAYQSDRLSNLGIGHGAIDAGGGYTYFNPATGHEFSGVLGFTYNFINTATQYQSGVDLHFDWGASQFLTKQVQVGLVGYAYKDIGCDSGSGDRVGCFQSQVFGIGPQFGYVFPLSQDPSGLHQSQGLRRIWRLGSALRLEHMADICHLTRSGASTRHEPDGYEIAAERTVGSSMSEKDQSRHFDRAPLTSGLPRLADILRGIRHASKEKPNVRRALTPPANPRVRADPCATSAADRSLISRLDGLRAEDPLGRARIRRRDDACARRR